MLPKGAVQFGSVELVVPYHFPIAVRQKTEAEDVFGIGLVGEFFAGSDVRGVLADVGVGEDRLDIDRDSVGSRDKVEESAARTVLIHGQGDIDVRILLDLHLGRIDPAFFTDKNGVSRTDGDAFGGSRADHVAVHINVRSSGRRFDVVQTVKRNIDLVRPTEGRPVKFEIDVFGGIAVFGNRNFLFIEKTEAHFRRSSGQGFSIAADGRAALCAVDCNALASDDSDKQRNRRCPDDLFFHVEKSFLGFVLLPVIPTIFG